MRIPGLGRARRALRAARVRLRPHGAILLYHRIAEDEHDPWSLCVAPERFAEQLEVLSRHAEVVPLRRLLDSIPTSRRRRPPVAITFDDGYADNLHQAKPLLECYDMPATVFVASGYLGSGREFWSDRLERIVLRSPTLPDRLSLAIDGGSFTWRSGDGAGGNGGLGAERSVLLLGLWQRMRPLPACEQDRLLDELGRWASCPEPPRSPRLPLTPEELRRLAADGLVEIGAHTVSHSQLPAHPRAEQIREIAESRAACEAVIGGPVTSFAYPYGRFDDVTVDCVHDAGLTLACSTMAALTLSDSDRFRLPRLVAKDWDGEAFERRFRSRFGSSFLSRKH